MKSTEKFITKCMQVETSLEWCGSLLSEFGDLEALQKLQSIKKPTKTKLLRKCVKKQFL